MATTKVVRRTSVAVATVDQPRSNRKASDRAAAANIQHGLSDRLIRSAVYRRLPLAERVDLDQAIVFRPAGCESIEAIAKRFDLEVKYGISVAALRSYAKKLEDLVRPEIESQFLAGVIGCLPEFYRQQVVDGGQVLLISRMLKSLNHEDTALTPAEMAKLASILLSLGKRVSPVPGKGPRRSESDGGDVSGSSDGEGAAAQEPIKLAESVRFLYGLSWPPDGTKSGPNTGGGTPAGPDGNGDPGGIGSNRKGSPDVYPEESTT